MPKQQPTEDVQQEASAVVRSAPIRWPDEDRGPWLVTVTWAHLSPLDRLVPIGVDLRSFTEEDEADATFLTAPGPGGYAEVNRDVIRGLPIASLIERSRQESAAALDRQLGLVEDAAWEGARRVARLAEVDPAGAAAARTPEVDRALQAMVAAVAFRTAEVEEAPRRGRPADRDEAFYEDVAKLYREAFRAGGEPARRPAQYVERRLRERGTIGETTGSAQVRKFISKARALGYLHPTQERRPGWTTGEPR